jgi:DNA-binding response OmpR family regulator
MIQKRILIVDDNELMVEVMTYILINNGYEVTSLTNANEVFNNIKTIHPDLVIIDDVLPGMDGTEMCKLLKLNKATRSLPVIICSGDDTIDTSPNQKGAPDDVLYKPFDINCLIKTVEHRLAA